MKYFSEEHLEQLQAQHKFVVATTNHMVSPAFTMHRTIPGAQKTIQEALDQLNVERIRLEAEIDVLTAFLKS